MDLVDKISEFTHELEALYDTIQTNNTSANILSKHFDTTEVVVDLASGILERCARCTAEVQGALKSAE